MNRRRYDQSLVFACNLRVIYPGPMGGWGKWAGAWRSPLATARLQNDGPLGAIDETDTAGNDGD
jgi:hypothetical protein